MVMSSHSSVRWLVLLAEGSDSVNLPWKEELQVKSRSWAKQKLNKSISSAVPKAYSDLGILFLILEIMVSKTKNIIVFIYLLIATDWFFKHLIPMKWRTAEMEVRFSNATWAPIGDKTNSLLTAIKEKRSWIWKGMLLGKSWRRKMKGKRCNYIITLNVSIAYYVYLLSY